MTNSIPHRWRWSLRLGGFIALTTLVAVVVVTLAPHLFHFPLPAQSSAHSDRTPLAIDVSNICAQGGYWSPDSHYIAILTATPCASPNILPDSASTHPSTPWNIAIFDSARGDLIKDYLLDDDVTHALEAQSAAVTFARTTYTDAAWSPDQRRVAILFETVGFHTIGGSARPIVSRAGIALVPLLPLGQLHATPRVWLAPAGQGEKAAIETNDLDLAQAQRWDLQTGAVTRLTLPPALTYRWLLSGQLTTDDPLPMADAAEPEDSSAGGTNFSLWRSVIAQPTSTVVCQSGARSTYTQLEFNTIAWAPNGRYLLRIALDAPLLIRTTRGPSGNASPCTLGSSPDTPALAPIRDAGMWAALHLLTKPGQSLELSWSPDGQRLAAAVLSGVQRPTSLTIYNAATGLPLKRVTAGPSNIPGAQGTDAQAMFLHISWAPDSNHIFATVAAQRVTMWVYGPHALGLN